MPFVEECSSFATIAGIDVAAMATYYTSCLRLSGSCGEGCNEFNLPCRSAEVTAACCGTDPSADDSSECGPGYFDDQRIPCAPGLFCGGPWQSNRECAACTVCPDCEDGQIAGPCGIGEGAASRGRVCH
jgi:hypothetical protein